MEEDGIKVTHDDATWKQRYYNFSLTPKPFSGPPVGLKNVYDKVPTMLQLFGFFWGRRVLRKICMETNRYATESLTVQKEDGTEETYTRGGPLWYSIDVAELKAFIALTLYMGLKKLANVR